MRTALALATLASSLISLPAAAATCVDYEDLTTYSYLDNLLPLPWSQALLGAFIYDDEHLFVHVSSFMSSVQTYTLSPSGVSKGPMIWNDVDHMDGDGSLAVIVVGSALLPIEPGGVVGAPIDLGLGDIRRVFVRGSRVHVAVDDTYLLLDETLSVIGQLTFPDPFDVRQLTADDPSGHVLRSTVGERSPDRFTASGPTPLASATPRRDLRDHGCCARGREARHFSAGQSSRGTINQEISMSIAKAGDTPLTLTGDPVKVGDTAPEFSVQLNDMSDLTLASHAGKTRIYCTLLSLDTSVCDTEMKRFNQDFASIPNSVVVCVSMDLPMTQARWCGANDSDNIIAASDHRDASFGRAYGCLVKGGKFDRTLYRAVFVVGLDDKVKYVEYVPELGSQPNFEAALAAAT